MNREEQIKQVAFLRDCENDFDSNDGRNGFIEGAEWADQHPKSVTQLETEEYIAYLQELLDTGANKSVSALLKMAMEWGLQHQPSPWISVEDRLPSEIGTYLILKNTENGYVDLAQYRSDWGWHNCVFNDPTHWMPIPPIEKGGEK